MEALVPVFTWIAGLVTNQFASTILLAGFVVYIHHKLFKFRYLDDGLPVKARSEFCSKCDCINCTLETVRRLHRGEGEFF